MIKTIDQMCLTVHPNSITKQLYPIQVILQDIASGENCDGDPYDQMVFAANLIDKLIAYIKGEIVMNDDLIVLRAWVEFQLQKVNSEYKLYNSCTDPDFDFGNLLPVLRGRRLTLEAMLKKIDNMTLERTLKLDT